MENEEIRRIQITGKSTYIISLPKKWVSEMGLKAGSQILISQEGSSIVLTPRDLASSKPKTNLFEAMLKISASDAPEKIARAIIATYLNGYNTIRIRASADHIFPLQRNAVRELVKRKIVGAEIISDSPQEMVIKVLVSYPELSVESALRRMCLIASSMHEDAVRALISLDKELAKNIIDLDDEVDRFGFYIIRQLKAAVQNDRILKEIGLSNPRDCLGYRVIVKFVERAADHAVRVAENVLSIDERLDGIILQKISEISAFTKSIFEEAVESLFKRDYLLAEKTVAKAEKVVVMEADAIRVIAERKINGTLSPRIRMILESIRRIGEYSSDIAEIVLNLNVNQIIVT
ncbi:MAG: phosphate uptake regulator PhoU [Candidatus Bathyarchaeota archaeon]|nr:phosphate uptake regulator PhoU [Candidatus Bathyarchaeota archaeon]